MKILKEILSFIVFACVTDILYAQPDMGKNPFLNDGNGRPLNLKTNYRSEGSPYLFEEYLPANLLTIDGRIYKNIKVKVNLVDNEIYYLLPDGKEMVSTMPIKQLTFVSGIKTIQDSLVFTSVKLPINAPGAAIYQICLEGKMSLFKQISITYNDLREYGNTNITRSFSRKERMLVFDYTGSLQMLGGEKAILGLLADKKKDLQQFITANHSNLKREKDLIALFDFYNSLQF
jgi:hypothetical protein